MNFNAIYRWGSRASFGLNVLSNFVLSTFGLLVPFLLLYNLILFFSGVNEYGYFDLQLFFNYTDDIMRSNTLNFLLSNEGRFLLFETYKYENTVRLMAQLLGNTNDFVIKFITFVLFGVQVFTQTISYAVFVLFFVVYFLCNDILDALVVISRFIAEPRAFFVQRNPLTYIFL